MLTVVKLRGRVIKFSAFFVRLCFSYPANFFTTDRMDFKEQRICIKFCFNLKKTAAETHRMLQEAFGDNAMSQSQRGLLRRRRWKLGFTVRKFLWSNSPNFWVAPRLRTDLSS